MRDTDKLFYRLNDLLIGYGIPAEKASLAAGKAWVAARREIDPPSRSAAMEKVLAQFFRRHHSRLDDGDAWVLAELVSELKI
jgi:hypothetical protein